MARAVKQTGAETVRWDLSDLYASPTDPKIEATLADSLERAKAFEAKLRALVPPRRSSFGADRGEPQGPKSEASGDP